MVSSLAWHPPWTGGPQMGMGSIIGMGVRPPWDKTIFSNSPERLALASVLLFRGDAPEERRGNEQ